MTTSLFTLACLMGAALLFVVQPMAAKGVLPVLGGTSAVWNTCMLFFQLALLAGYIYVHVTRRMDVRRLAVLHVLLLILCMAPLLIWHGAGPTVGSNPVASLLLHLARTIGAPFVVIAATAPLVQRWFLAMDRTGTRDPYFLYAASNLGSLVALLAYPILIEPTFRLREQAFGWTLGYALLGVLLTLCAIRVGRSSVTSADAPHGSAPTWPRRLRWAGLAMVPSSLLLSVTTYATTNVGPTPLFWVVPLAIYLLSFVLVFAQWPIVPHRWIVRLFPFCVVALAVVLFWSRTANNWEMLWLHGAVFFVIALLCHGELAATRPAPSYLTEFYCWIALGGALGGCLNALVAPLLFTIRIEYPLMLITACLLAPGQSDSRAKRWLDFAFPAATVSVLAVSYAMFRESALEWKQLWMLAPGAVLCLLAAARSIRFGASVAAVLVAGSLFATTGTNVIYRERSFYATHHIEEWSGDNPTRFLINGSIQHGLQHMDVERRREPTTYFHRTSPIGELIRTQSYKLAEGRIGVVGLGVGTLAAYGEPGQRWSFYEIDPAVVRTAREYFYYLEDSKATVEVVLGDGRLSLAREPDGSFDMLVFDAFSSDAIPLHLLTSEAMEMYLHKLKAGGVLAFHLSHTAADLTLVLANLSRDLGLVFRTKGTGVEEQPDRIMRAGTFWGIVARQPQDIAALSEQAGWATQTGRADLAAWSDDFTNLWSVLRLQ